MSERRRGRGTFLESRASRVYGALVGAGDALTGLLLVAAPLRTLRLMGIAAVPPEPVYLRFIGVFVAAVGLSYLYPFVLDRERRGERLRTVFETTALTRLGVAAFVAASVGAGALGAAWLSVASTDGVLALFQAGVLWRSRRPRVGG